MQRFSNNPYTRTLCVLLISMAAALPITAMAGNGVLTVQRNAAFDKDLNVRDAIRTECKLEQKVPEFVEEFAKKDFDSIVMADQVSAGTKGRALSMKITDVSRAGGGAWSGSKFVTVEGTLWQDGKVAGTFRATRHSRGGAFGGYKGTCAILGRCAKAVGKDIAGWARAPSMDARLGDSKK